MCAVVLRKTLSRRVQRQAAAEWSTRSPRWMHSSRKSHSYGVRPALTSVLCNGCRWQMCASPFSVVRGIKTALCSSLYTRMRWKIMIPLQRSALLTSMKAKGKASYCRTDSRLLVIKTAYRVKGKWTPNKLMTSNFLSVINIYVVLIVFSLSRWFVFEGLYLAKIQESYRLLVISVTKEIFVITEH